jgi:hypothetical protein
VNQVNQRKTGGLSEITCPFSPYGVGSRHRSPILCVKCTKYACSVALLFAAALCHTAQSIQWGRGIMALPSGEAGRKQSGAPQRQKSEKGEPCAMNAAKKVMNTLKENYMEYVAMCYGPFDK